MRQFSALFGQRQFAFALAAVLLALPNPCNLRIRAQEIKGFSEQSQRDWQLNNLARRALLKDDVLSSQNIGVTVKQNVATFWGNLPSPEMAKRVEQTLLKIPGITKVVSDCRMVPATDPVPQALADAVNRARELAGDPSISTKLVPPQPSPTSMASRQTVAKPAPDGTTPKATDIALPPASPPAAFLLPPASAQARTDDAPAPEKIRLSEKRFKDLTLNINDGIVKVNGSVARMKDAWDLAEKLNGAPGVRQVMIGQVVEK